MKKITLASLALWVCAHATLQAGVEEWYKLLPADTFGIIEFKNPAELVTNWEKSGLGRMMQDEEFLRWTAPMRKGGDAPWDSFFKEHSGEGMKEYLMRHPGANLAAFIAASPADFEKGVAFVAFTEVVENRKQMEELKAKEKELVLAADEEMKARVIELAGQQVEVVSKSDEPDEMWEVGHAFVGDVLIEANTQALMEQMILAVKNGAVEPSDAITGHLARLDALAGGTPDLRIYLNGEKLMQWADEAARSTGKQLAKSSPLPVSPDQVIEALGLREMQALGVMMNLDDEKSALDVAILHPAKPQGLLSLVRSVPGPVEQPAFVPAGVMAASAMRLSMTELWDKLLAMVEKFGPAAQMLTGQLGVYEQQLGVKLRDDLFASLDDQYHEITQGDAQSPSQVILFKVKDEKRLGGAIEAIKRLMGAGFGAFDESEYLGHTIQSVKTAQAQDGSAAFAFCVAEGHLLMSNGPQTLLRDVLSRMKEPSGPGLWEDAQVQDLVKKLPESYVGLSVADGSRTMNMIVQALGLAQSGLAAQGIGKGPKAAVDEAENDSLGDIFDASATPSEEMWSRYFGKAVSGVYNPEDAIQLRMISAPPAQP